jgi:rhamnosyltransferase
MSCNKKTIFPALIITHHPAPEFFTELPRFFEQFQHLLIVDNASVEEMRLRLDQAVAKNGAARLTIIYNLENCGIASALNQGFRWALDQGYEHLVVFDQDSRPASNLTNELLRVYQAHPHRERLAILAPRIVDGRTGESAPVVCWHGYRLRKDTPHGDVLENVALVITSGSLNNLSAYRRLGPFCEDFFVDYVDTEYCLRAQERGYKIIVACNAILHHRLGNQQTKQVGLLAMRPTFHSPLRWYYINRNRIAMYRLYALRFPQWVLHDVSIACYALLKMLLFEDQKLRKILALVLGVFDGILRRMGPASVKRKASITTGQ